MPRGFFTQSATVLFERRPSLADIAPLFPEVERYGKPTSSWMGSDEELVLRFDEARNGTIVIDVVDAAWPDGMGDPKDDPDLFGAWTMGAFGPLAFPGNLARAAAHSALSANAQDIVARHRSFVRIRSCYVLGAGPDAPILPEGWDGLLELAHVVDVARRVLDLPFALAYFDPNGEVLASTSELEETRSNAIAQDLPPIDLYTNARFFEIGDRAGWSLMDTVGMDRFLLPDVELAFPRTVDANDVGVFLRDVQIYFLQRGGGIPEGDRVEGPGGAYRALQREKSLVPAPRAVVRLVPEFAVPPGAVLD